MNKTILAALLSITGSAYWPVHAAAGEYGLPAEIQQGNILHCFNWTPAEVKAELQSIAEAGFGAVQLSPLQRPDISVGSSWKDLYRPYDLALKSSGFCSEQDLKDLCTEADRYGIKIIVDVVANHMDPSAGFHDGWWDSSDRLRSEGPIDYGSRRSITHGQIDDCADVNSELADVAARGKAYVEKLKILGVKGIRWDAAKYIGLPSEGCDFWSEVTSVGGMYHYGVIADSPGDDALIKEYAKYMSVTDNRYSETPAKLNGGVPVAAAGEWVEAQGCPESRMVYWGESHNSYAEDDGWSKFQDQWNIDRAYAAFACRKDAAALYLVRPDEWDSERIRVGKGRNAAYQSKHIAEVNKFRNIMVGRDDRFEANDEGCCITRKDGGAVIIAKRDGYFSITNGGGYCPAGKYTDRVSGYIITVTPEEIYGQIGEEGIAVIYSDDIEPGITPDPDPTPDPTPDPNPNPDPDPDPTPGPTPEPEPGNYVYFNATDEYGDSWATTIYVWAWNGTTPCVDASGYPGDVMTHVEGNLYRWDVPEGKMLPAQISFARAVGYMMYEKAGGYDLQYLNQRTYFTDGHAETIIYTTPDPDPTPGPVPGPLYEVPDALYVLGDIEGAAWDPAHGAEMISDGNGTFISREKIKFVSSRDGNSYFGLTDRLGSDWDDLNARANRYGPAERDTRLDLNGQSDFCLFSGKDAGGANSWQVRPGAYYIKADFNTGRVELAESTVVSLFSLEADDLPAYYTLQGVRVDNPQSGVYIRVSRTRTDKILIP